jgi:hypothetical protein
MEQHSNSLSQPEHTIWLEILEWPMIGAYNKNGSLSSQSTETAKNIFLKEFKDNPTKAWSMLSDRFDFYSSMNTHAMEWCHAQVKRVDLFDGLEQQYIFKGIVGKRYSSMIRLQVQSTAFLGELRLPNWSEPLWNPFKGTNPDVAPSELNDLSVAIHWPESIAVTWDGVCVGVPLNGSNDYIHDIGVISGYFSGAFRRKREIHCNPNSTCGVNYRKPTKSAGKRKDRVADQA